MGFPGWRHCSNPLYDTKASDVSVTLSYATGTQSISTEDYLGNATSNSWQGNGFVKDAVNTAYTGPYFQIAIDTSQYSDVTLSLRSHGTASWGPANTLKVWSSTDNTTYNASPTGTGALLKSAWSGDQVFDAFATGTGTTYFRINADGANPTNAAFQLDHIIITGCAEPTPPPTFEKFFGTDPIKVGGISKLDLHDCQHRSWQCGTHQS